MSTQKLDVSSNETMTSSRSYLCQPNSTGDRWW